MRYCGKIGFVTTKETVPGVYKPEVVEREYFGDVTRLMSRWENGTSTNDDISINNQFSIVADPFAYENFQYMKYIEFMGAMWSISSIEVQRPRLIISIGGLYNGE